MEVGLKDVSLTRSFHSKTLKNFSLFCPVPKTGFCYWGHFISSNQINKLNWQSDLKSETPLFSTFPLDLLTLVQIQIALLTCLEVGFLSCWMCSDWTSCSDAPQSCPLMGHPLSLLPVWSLHVQPHGQGLLLYPHLGHGGSVASESFEVWLWRERKQTRKKIKLWTWSEYKCKNTNTHRHTHNQTTRNLILGHGQCVWNPCSCCVLL